jgi:hypothetical protein
MPHQTAATGSWGWRDLQSPGKQRLDQPNPRVAGGSVWQRLAMLRSLSVRCRYNV